MDLSTKEKQRYRCRSQTYGFQGQRHWEIGPDIHIFLYIKQTTDKDLLYSTGNSIQYSVMIYMGLESKKSGRIFMYN